MPVPSLGAAISELARIVTTPPVIDGQLRQDHAGPLRHPQAGAIQPVAERCVPLTVTPPPPAVRPSRQIQAADAEITPPRVAVRIEPLNVGLAPGPGCLDLVEG